MKLSVAAVACMSAILVSASTDNSTLADASRMVKRGKTKTKKAAASQATVYSTCAVPGTFALTFDDGPYIYEQKLVQFLNSQGVQASFFVNGNNYDCIYDRAESLQAAYSAGHMIGSHTWSHADITKLSASGLKSELSQLEVALDKILGLKPALFRPPYGAYNDQSLQQLAANGYKSAIYWDFDSGDSTGSSAAQSKSAYKKWVGSLKSKSTSIALNHETYQSTVDTVIPYAISLIKQKKLKMVSVASCLGIAPYQYETHKLGKRDSTWHC